MSPLRKPAIKGLVALGGLEPLNSNDERVFTSWGGFSKHVCTLANSGIIQINLSGVGKVQRIRWPLSINTVIRKWSNPRSQTVSRAIILPRNERVARWFKACCRKCMCFATTTHFIKLKIVGPHFFPGVW